MKRLALALTLAAATSVGCGDDGGDETATSAEKIVIETHAELQSVVDTGEVLGGSSLGETPFCPKGTFSGGHGNTDNGWLDKTFECADGTLTIAFDPGDMTQRSASGPWEVLEGTGVYEGMEGSGEFVIKFPADPQATEGHETFTGTVSQ